ncbi:hypothetical protein BX600DRAFT_527092 [Xylariales sp. PMI_506]|nr:hypothetical protein BX600DRAFT_527092 [Xylariales sp. PMI_506]
MAYSEIPEGQHEPVAIVGMGCRWAGGVRDPTALWELLTNNREGWQEFDAPRFSNKGFHHESPDRPGSIRTRGGFLVHEDARLFDPSFFGITNREVETLDPSQRKLLEVVYEAFENAGETWESISGSRTGVFIGNFAFDHLLIQARDWESPRPYAATGADTSILANRISYIFNLHGPSLATNTACSSSMYALYMAVRAIRNGDCDGAIVAAANWISDPSMQIVLDKLGALSPTSRCHTFDASADGYARGEGYAALYLKRSSAAILHGLPIRAMIRGVAVNANGRTGGITRPSALGQEDVIRQAYKDAGDLPFAETAFFECHGTGTQAGDPLEVAAIGSVFAASRSDAPEEWLRIGSIKPNLGHTEGASAIASIMKIILSLEAGQIPPTYGIRNLNPNIDFDKAKVVVVKDHTIPWPEGKLRRASVNSFGFGGANGHCVIDHVNNVLPGYKGPGIIMRHGPANGYSHITNGLSNGNHTINGNGVHEAEPLQGLEELPFLSHIPRISGPQKTPKVTASTRQLVLLPFSAHNPLSLQENIETLSNIATKWSLADIAYTLSQRRSRLQHRTFRIVDRDNVSGDLKLNCQILTSPLQASKVGYVLTGQGAQWHAMGSQLFEYAAFRTTIQYLDHLLSKLPDPPSWALLDILSGLCDPDDIQSPQVSQVACTAVQIGLVDLLASWSVRPVAVVGHSSGEMAAAYAAGRITAAEAITAAYYRGRAVSSNTRDGAMLAVGLGTNQVSCYIDGYREQIKIAAMNSPDSVTLSGDADAIQKLSVTLTENGVFNRILRTGGNAYHSHHMASIGQQFEEMLANGIEHIMRLGLVDQSRCYPPIKWLSSVTPEKEVAHGVNMASYWRSNLESPVRFAQAVANMMDQDSSIAPDILVEIGPHSALKSPIEQIVKAAGKSAQYAVALKRDQDARTTILQLAGLLFGLNAELDMVAVNAVDIEEERGKWSLAHGCTAVDFPPYRYPYPPISYYESRTSKEFRLRKNLRHELIGSRVPGASALQPQWRNVLRVKDLPWLADHRLIPDAVFPGAGFVVMAVEAATQIHMEVPESAPITGYALRKVDISAALRIPEDDDGIEILLAMQPADVAKSTSWVRFTISSVARESDEWTQHCTGLIMLELSDSGSKEHHRIEANMDARHVALESWYQRFAEIGIGYGPTFQALSDIRVDPHLNQAKATLATHSTVYGESRYAVHPTDLDSTFQLGLIACYGGQVERATAAYVPVYLSQLYIKANKKQNETQVVVARGRIQGLRNAYVQLQMLDADGNVLLNVDTLRLTRFKDATTSKQGHLHKMFSSPFARLVWQPDFRTLNNNQARRLFPPPSENNERITHLERADMICCLVVADIYETFVGCVGGPQPKGELAHWLSWVKWCGEEDQRENMIKAMTLSPDDRHKLLQKLYDEAGPIPEALAARHLHENMSEILNAEKTGIDVLISEGLLTALYETGHVIAGSHPQLYNVLDSLGHANPNLRIIEVGAGTGAASRVAMKALTGPNGIKRYADYTYTDISAGFLGAAREFMSEYRDIHYSVLDIEKDPLENGYEPHAYDVVLACEAIHATESMSRTLAHCRSLLKPGGKLILAETTTMRVMLGLLYGTLTGYWIGASDGRTEGPFMDKQIWDSRLREAGFSGLDVILDDYPEPYASTSVLVATLQHDQSQRDSSTIWLLHDSGRLPTLLGLISAELESRNIVYETASIDDASGSVPENARVLACVTDQNDIFDISDQKRLSSYQYLSRSVESMIFLIVSGDKIQGLSSPRGAFMAGLLRAIATENPAGHFVSISLKEEDMNLKYHDSDLVRAILDQVLSLPVCQTKDGSSVRDMSSTIFYDSEFVWKDDCMWVSRLVPDATLSPYVEENRTPSHLGFEMISPGFREPLCAAFETPGILASLYFRPYTELLEPLPSDYIDVKVAVVGLNWKDLALASARFDAITNDLSSEYAGTVTRIGDNVTGLAVGDRVYGVGRGHFGNYTRVPAAFAHRLQPTDDIEEVATMPLVYMTALYALQHVARIQKRHKILIQSATGGLGLAAIQLARYVGAEIYATAGSANKRSFLVDTLGFPADHVLPSRDAAALQLASEAIGGFNIILSTVSGGDSLSSSLGALAPTGHLIDLSRVDVLESKDLGLELFQKNATFSSFDLNVVLDHDPTLGCELMASLDRLYREGHISPIRPYTVHSVSELDKVLAIFSKGAHIGKLVVSFQETEALLKVVKQPQVVNFDPDARYIITGGFGGLGRSIIRWMIGHGARDILVLSRRGASTPAAQMLVNNLIAQGNCIQAVPCDVSRKEDVMAAIEKASSLDGRPIRGVLHAALSLSDLSFDKLTVEQWQKGLAAKTHGTINLHEATLSSPLDFFVMLTSTESVWAPPTQSSYIAATNFQEHFARYRQSLGLPGASVACGLVTDVASDFKHGSIGTEDMYARNKALTTTEWQVLATLEPAFLNMSTAVPSLETKTPSPPPWIGYEKDPLSVASYFTCLDPARFAVIQGKSSTQPRWHSDGRVSLIMRATHDAIRHGQAEANEASSDAVSLSATARLRSTFDQATSRTEISPESRNDILKLVMDGIMQTIAEMTFMDVRNVNPERSIAEHGVDSLIAAELRHWFHQALATKLQMLDLLDARTSIKDLASAIVDKAINS